MGLELRELLMLASMKQAPVRTPGKEGAKGKGKKDKAVNVP